MIKTKPDHDASNFNWMQKRIQESQVFITEYVDKLTSFSAIIKQRYSDFQVFEIDQDGNEVHLTSLENNLHKPEPTPCENKLEDVDINEQPVSELTYPIEDPEQLRQLTLLMKRKKKSENIKIDVTGIDKCGRTSVHNLISHRYKGALLTRTVDAEDRKEIIVSTNKQVDCRNFKPWPKDTQPYLHFVLYKENIDTMSAARLLSRFLKVNQKCISYAGTKDRRAVTTQRMSVRQVTPERILSRVNKHSIWCGHFEYKNEPLKLGQLQGNRFVIVLRNVVEWDAVIENTLKNFKEKGFINYYGLQRFGSYSTSPTFEIGKCLLQKQWLQAINLILVTPVGGDEKALNLRRAIEAWHDKKSLGDAVKCILRNNSPEAIILKTLAAQGSTAYINALQKIPRNVVLLYLHAFQSLVWNRIVSRRIREHGLNVLAGDLVYISGSTEVLDTVETEDEEPQQEETEKLLKIVKADEISTTSIYDVVYPLPGHSVTYPENEIAEWYKEVMREYEVHELDGKHKMISLPGAYRKMMVIPRDVKWRTVFYDNPSADILETELQKFEKKSTVENLECGIHKAVILELTLPSSSYATMALREITKRDTSTSYHTSLSNIHTQIKKPKLEPEDSLSSTYTQIKKEKLEPEDSLSPTYTQMKKPKLESNETIKREPR